MLHELRTVRALRQNLKRLGRTGELIEEKSPRLGAWGAEQALAMPKKKPESVKSAPPPYEVRVLRRTSACARE